MKYGNVFTKIMMFSLKKVDSLRERELEQEEKGTTNSAPKHLLVMKIPRFSDLPSALFADHQMSVPTSRPEF